MKLGLIIQRNVKLFFKDKGMVISSMITPMILILLYVTFLKNVYVDSFESACARNGITIDQSYINGFVYGWLFSSLLAVSCITVSFCSNLLMVQDKSTGAIKDLTIAPVKKTTLAVGYYIGSLIVTLIICYIEVIVSFIFLASKGWYLSISDVFMILLEVFLLVNLGTTISSIIHFFLSTQGQMSAVGTLVSSVYGFICGAYMPISQFGKGLQNVLSFLPGTYGTAVVRYSYEHGVLEALKSDCNFPSEVVDGIASSFDIQMKFFDTEVSFGGSFTILTLSIVLFIVIYVLMNMKEQFKKITNKSIA